MVNTEKILKKLLSERILLMDGAMGTMIQQHHLSEGDYRGSRFVDFSAPKGQREIFLKGNNELLNITQPAIIQKIHEVSLKVIEDESTTYLSTFYKYLIRK